MKKLAAACASGVLAEAAQHLARLDPRPLTRFGGGRKMSQIS
jgi:hypothetical protein